MEPLQRRCPTCDVNLQREDYESSWAMRCPSCRGALLSTSRLEHIKRDGARSPDLLKKEARAEHWSDTEEPIPCPRCHAVMKKLPLTRGAATLHLDHCRACDLIWLDGGELALAQLIYETSPQGREARLLQHRALAASMSEERQARFERALARMPDKLPGDDSTDDQALLGLLKPLLRI